MTRWQWLRSTSRRACRPASRETALSVLADRAATLAVDRRDRRLAGMEPLPGAHSRVAVAGGPAPLASVHPTSAPRKSPMADQPMPPSGALDTSKSYRARFKTERGEIACRAACRPGSAHGGELRQPGSRRLLRRDHLPSRDPRLHGPGRRSHRHRARRTGLPVRRRVQPRPAPRRARRALDGQCRAGHQRQPVLHHLRRHAAPGRPPLGLRAGESRAWTC